MRNCLCFFLGVFQNACGEDPNGKLWLQDGDPRQNSKAARTEWEKLGCEMFSIPARSPDLNPIENLFHNIRTQLSEDAFKKKIMKEDYGQFVARIKKTFEEYPKDIINKTIASMPRRMAAVVKSRGFRTKW